MIIDATIGIPTPEHLRNELTATLYGMFRKELPEDVARQVSRQVRRARERRNELPPEYASEVVKRLEFSAWMPLVEPVGAALASGSRDAGVRSLWRLGISDSEPEARTTQRFAEQWANARAAELIGMRREASGKLVAKPNARFAITDTTRDMVRSTVAEAIRRDWTSDELADQLRQTNAFSPSRAEMIARTELKSATNRGQMIAFRTSGLVSGVRWITMKDNRVEPHCRDNERAGTVEVGVRFPSGARHPPAHPNCRCRLAAVVS